jgi:hypothetical protein
VTCRELLEAFDISIVDATEWNAVVGYALGAAHTGQNNNDQNQNARRET